MQLTDRIFRGLYRRGGMGVLVLLLALMPKLGEGSVTLCPALPERYSVSASASASSSSNETMIFLGTSSHIL